MKHKLLKIIAFSLVLIFLSSCAVQEKTVEVVLPESLLQYNQTDAEEMAAKYRSEMICQDVYVRGEDLVLVVTQEQFEDLRQENEQTMQSFRDELAEEDYWLEESGDYTAFKFYCDESVPMILNLKILQGMSSCYGIAQVLGGNMDWSVEVTVVNCHTNNTVATFICPGTGNFDYDDWQRSYEVDESVTDGQ